MTPSDEALQRDVELVKSMGFNGCASTKMKIPFPVLGGCAGAAGLGGDAQRLSIHSQSGGADYTEWTEVIERDVSHPCIVVWVPFSESWEFQIWLRRRLTGTSSALLLDKTLDSPSDRQWLRV